MIFAMSNSVASSLIFMKNNPEILMRWVVIFRSCCCPNERAAKKVGRLSGLSIGSQSDCFDGSAHPSLVFSEGSDYFVDELFSTSSSVTLRHAANTITSSSTSTVQDNPLMTQMRTISDSRAFSADR